AALYTQMTLYGPVERATIDAFAPALLVCERHPVVDTLAYGPFYRRMVQKTVDEAMVAAPLRAEIERRAPGGYDAVRAWHARENRRLAIETSFSQVAHDVCGQLARPLGEVITEFGRRYRATLPQRVVFIDVEPEEARARIVARSGQTELHETV